MTKFFQFDNLMIELGDDQAPIIESMQKRDNLISGFQSLNQELQGKLEKAELQIAQLTDSISTLESKNELLLDASQKDDFIERYNTRRELERIANLDSVNELTDRQIKEKVILDSTKFTNLDDKSDASIDGMFEVVVNLKKDNVTVRDNKDSLVGIERKDTVKAVQYADIINAKRLLNK